jgi:ribose transport system substrate-binding protein
MKRTRRIRGMLGVLVAGALLSACGGPSSGTSSSKTTASKDKGPSKIGLSVFFAGNSWQAENIQLFKDACKARPAVIARCTVQNANGSTSQQIAQLQGMINQKVDAILLDANSATGLNGIVKRAMNAGIPVVNYDSIITGDATSKINTDQLKWGQITGKWLVDQLHGKGNVIVLNGLAGNPTNNLRYQDTKARFKRTPGIKVLAESFAEWDQAKAQAAVSRLLDAYPKIDGVWSQGGAMTAGAMIEFKKAGRKLVPMTGEDYNGFLKLWKENKANGFTSLSPGQPNYLVTLALEAAVRTLQGKPVPKVVDVPLPVITDETVDEAYRPDKPPSYWTLDTLRQSEVDKLLAG